MAAPQIVHAIGILLFSGAGGTAIGVIATTIAPQRRRILRLALGHVDDAPRAIVRTDGAT